MNPVKAQAMSRKGKTDMSRPTITIYKETVPKHYVGTDCAIVLKYKCEEWEADLIAMAIETILDGNDYEVTLDDSVNREITCKGTGKERR